MAIDGDAGEIFTATIAGTGRRTLEVPVDASNLVSRMVRVRLYSTTQFKVHDMAIQVTPVPIYIKAGEPWQSEEVPL